MIGGMDYIEPTRPEDGFPIRYQLADGLEIRPTV
jgi:hypothetical protein